MSATVSNQDEGTLYANALTAALHAGDYRPVSALACRLYMKQERRRSLEKYIQYAFAEELRRICKGPALEWFLVELYKGSVRNIILQHIIYIVNA